MLKFEIKSIKSNVWDEQKSIASFLKAFCHLSNLGTRPGVWENLCPFFFFFCYALKISPSLHFARSNKTALILIQVNPNLPLYAPRPLLLLDLISTRVLVQHSTTLSLCSAESFHTWTARKWMQVAKFTCMTYNGDLSFQTATWGGGGKGVSGKDMSLFSSWASSHKTVSLNFSLAFLGTICMNQNRWLLSFFFFPFGPKKRKLWWNVQGMGGLHVPQLGGISGEEGELLFFLFFIAE